MLLKTDQRGFTLVEVLVVLSILGVLIVLANDLWLNTITLFRSGGQRVKLQDEVSRAKETINEELRYATEVNIRQDLPHNIEDRITEYSYITVENVEGQPAVVNYIRNELGEIDRARRKLANSVKRPEGGYYNYQLSFERPETGLVDYDLEVPAENVTIQAGVHAANTEDPIGGSQGTVIEYVPLEADLAAIWDDLGWNPFWRDFVRSSYTDTLKTGPGDYSWEQNTDGEELSVNIARDEENNTLGGMLFSKMKPSYFDDIPADIDSFSVIIDAQLAEERSWGYGVLLRGGYDPENQVDYGYMFQFDPAAEGFLLRRIFSNAHNVEGGRDDGHIGARIAEDPYNVSPPAHSGFYYPMELQNDSFWSEKEFLDEDDNKDFAYNEAEFWNQRYQTKLTVQTQPNGELIIRAQVIDEAGNTSNEIWFGDFGRVQLGETEVVGGRLDESYNDFEADKGLDQDYFTDGTGDAIDSNELEHDAGNYDGDFPGRYLGIRSWTGAHEDYLAEFYELEITGAKPAVKEVKVDKNEDKIELLFDDALGLTADEVTDDLETAFNLPAAPDDVEIKTIEAGYIEEQQAPEQLGKPPWKLTLELSNEFTTAQGDLTANELLYSPSTTDLITDQFGNPVEEFEINLAAEMLVEYSE